MGIERRNGLFVRPGDGEMSLFQRVHMKRTIGVQLLNHRENERHAGTDRKEHQYRVALIVKMDRPGLNGLDRHGRGVSVWD